VGESPSLEGFKHRVDVALGDRFSRHGGVGVTVGLDLRGLLQPPRFCDSNGGRAEPAQRRELAVPHHSRMKPVELEGLTLSQLSALSLLEISSSELEPGEPTSASSNLLLSPALAIASIGPGFAWGAGGRRGGSARPPALGRRPPGLPAGSPRPCGQGEKL